MARKDTLWLSNPTLAYRDWQVREAAGANRRPFSARSIVQHEAMFEHFRRHLLARGRSVASFGTDDIDAFWQTPDARTYSQATRMRYAKLLDRLCRHLIFAGVREDNPAAGLLASVRWPEEEPTPQYLEAPTDRRLQAYLRHPAEDLASLRSRAIVATFLGQASPQPRRVRRALASSTPTPRHLICSSQDTAHETRVPCICPTLRCRCCATGWRAGRSCRSREIDSFPCAPTGNRSLT